MNDPMTQRRATDTERERTAELLRAAAGEGCLTVDELEQRVAAAYQAVTRADLAALLRDLPPLPSATAPPAAPAYAPAPAPGIATRRRSAFWVWGLIPWLGAAAWVHAALLTRDAKYWRLAAVYAVPILLAAITDQGGEAELPGWVVGIAIAFWVVNGIHAWMSRAAVDAARVRARE